MKRQKQYLLPNYSHNNPEDPIAVKATDIIPHLPSGIFDKASFINTVMSVSPGCSGTTIDWMLHSLRTQGLLGSAGAGRYYLESDATAGRKKYSFPHSPEYLEIENKISGTYPLISFQMWELIQMNDFVNHLIAKNVIFIEAEGMLVDTVFELLHKDYPYAMFQPDTETFFRQRAPETDIVVQKLLSEAPSPDDRHSCKIEKLIVDLFSKRLSGRLIERSEYRRIVEDVFLKYNINETRLFRYARRRNLYDEIVSFITKQTDVKLLTI